MTYAAIAQTAYPLTRPQEPSKAQREIDASFVKNRSDRELMAAAKAMDEEGASQQSVRASMPPQQTYNEALKSFHRELNKIKSPTAQSQFLSAKNQLLSAYMHSVYGGGAFGMTQMPQAEGEPAAAPPTSPQGTEGVVGEDGSVSYPVKRNLGPTPGLDFLGIPAQDWEIEKNEKKEEKKSAAATPPAATNNPVLQAWAQQNQMDADTLQRMFAGLSLEGIEQILQKNRGLAENLEKNGVNLPPQIPPQLAQILQQLSGGASAQPAEPRPLNYGMDRDGAQNYLQSSLLANPEALSQLALQELTPPPPVQPQYAHGSFGDGKGVFYEKNSGWRQFVNMGDDGDGSGNGGYKARVARGKDFRALMGEKNMANLGELAKIGQVLNVFDSYMSNNQNNAEQRTFLTTAAQTLATDNFRGKGGFFATIVYKDAGKMTGDIAQNVVSWLTRAVTGELSDEEVKRLGDTTLNIARTKYLEIEQSSPMGADWFRNTFRDEYPHIVSKFDLANRETVLGDQNADVSSQVINKAAEMKDEFANEGEFVSFVMDELPTRYHRDPQLRKAAETFARGIYRNAEFTLNNIDFSTE